MHNHELELGFSNDEILAGHDVSLRTVQRMRGVWLEYGVVHILGRLYEDELLAYLDERPMAYLDEIPS